jgi:alpha-ribazole phosphatase/probable phosphoglycerate mutase
MLNVYLLRHGETYWNRDGNKYCGRSDISLTEKGIRQARQVSQQINQLSLDAIYASPLQRAYDTAKIASAQQQKVIRDERLIEVDFGQWEGKPKEQFIPENRELRDNWMADPATTQAGGTGETAKQVIDRVDAFFKDAIQKHVNETILVVAHNGVNRLYLAHKLGMPLGNYRKIVQKNSTVSLFSLDREQELTLHQLNNSR